MSDPKANNPAEIEGLLAIRQQLTSWLDRLGGAGSRAPAAVRLKVRQDYEARLTQVVDQLRAHADVVASGLQSLRAQASEFAQLRTDELSIRAEAELRHAVGEYTDDEWQLVELQSAGKIQGLDQELERLTLEIQRLEEVQSLIAPPVPDRAMAAAHAQAAEASPPLVLVRNQAAPPPPEPAAPAAPEAPRFVPRGGRPARESGPSRAIPFPNTGQPSTPAPAPTKAPAPAATAAPGDELAFLKSMTIDSPPPSARITLNPAAHAVGALDREERSSNTVAKTLKCNECGTLNRPTEWYCERCGAELAAL